MSEVGAGFAKRSRPILMRSSEHRLLQSRAPQLARSTTMNAKKQTRRAKARRFLVGGNGYVSFGKKKRLARIVENRGMIGWRGRQLLRVVFADSDDVAGQAFEIPAADVTPAKSSAPSPRKIKARAEHA